MIWDQATIWNAVVVSFALTAAAGDARSRTIPRLLTTTAFFAGICFHVVHGTLTTGFVRGGLPELGYSLAAALIGFAVGLTLFQLGAIGGGDVKLITALGAMLGLPLWMSAMKYAIFAAAAIAIFQAVRRGVLKQTFLNIIDTFRWVLTKGGKQHPVVNVSNAKMLRAPFGVAAAIGTLAAVMKL